jgi:Fe-Mn family superoxide dismutase
MFELPDLPYKYDALEPYIDKETMMLHHDKHHASYVNSLNDAIKGIADLEKMEIEQLLANLDKVPENIRVKVNNNGGGHYNHSLFWNLMSPQKEAPDNNLLKILVSTFGSFDNFKEKFTQIAVSHFGSGWGWLVLNNGKLEIMDTPNQDSPISSGKIPILGVDVWEHAYYLKYQNRRVEYISAWWNVVNWKKVSSLFAENLQVA